MGTMGEFGEELLRYVRELAGGNYSVRLHVEQAPETTRIRVYTELGRVEVEINRQTGVATIESVGTAQSVIGYENFTCAEAAPAN